MLDEERSYYEQMLPEWLNKYQDRVVLVKGRELIGTYNSEGEALAEGTRRFGLESYLVRRVLPTQAAINLPAYTLGLLNADSVHPVSQHGN